LNRIGDANRLKLALQGVHPKKISKTLTWVGLFTGASNWMNPFEYGLAA
jgi:hypothetical protein